MTVLEQPASRHSSTITAIEEDQEAQRPAHLLLKKLARALEEFGT